MHSPHSHPVLLHHPTPPFPRPNDDEFNSTFDIPHHKLGFLLTDNPISSDNDGLPPLSPIFPSFDHSSVISSSPAAMFLSAFSPSASAAHLPDDEGEQVEGYKLGPIVGYGGFSSIRRGFSPSGGTVAVKIVRRSDLASQADSPQARERLENEASIWKTLSHEHILPLFHSVHTHYADFFFMLLCPAGTLYDILKRDGRPALSHDDAGMMFRQVVRGVRYLHEQMALVHSDLKLENVLVDEMGVCRICDFGMTRSIEEAEDIDEDLPAPPPAPHGLRNHRSALDPAIRLPRTSSLLSARGSLKATGHLSHLIHHPSRPRRRESTPLPTHAQNQTPHVHAVYEFPPGSLPYASPELLRRPDAHPYRPHPAQDIWALGVMLYALLTGGLPFVDSFEPRLTMKILHGAFDMPKNVGRGAELVLRGCLEASVPQRWTIAAVDEVSWSVGWGTETDDSLPGSAENEFEQMVHETNERAKKHRTSRSGSRSRTHSPTTVPGHDASHDALPELEYDPEPMGGSGAFARSTSSRSRSTGTGPFSPFTNAWSEIEMPPSVCPPELALLGTPPAQSAPPLALVECPRGRSHHAAKRREEPSMGALRSRSSSVAPLSPASAEMRGRQGIAARPVPALLGLGLSIDARRGSKRAGSQPPARSTPWALPSRARASVGVSPALSVAFSTPHADGGFVLNSGVAGALRSRSSGRS